MTESLVVLQRKDPKGNTVLAWFECEGDACLDDWMAQVSYLDLLTKPNVTDWVRQMAHGLFANELFRDPNVDLSWLTTHHQVEPGGPIEPNEVTS